MGNPRRGGETKMKWGDTLDEDEWVEGKQELGPDEYGVKTVIECHYNDKGQKVKTVRKVKLVRRTVKKNRRVEQRKEWERFGLCKGMPVGEVEPGVTMVGDSVEFEFIRKEKKKEQMGGEKSGGMLGVVCRNCGRAGEHWTRHCPYKDKLGNKDPDEDYGTGQTSSSSKFVIPAHRMGADGKDRKERDESCTLRVTNLSEDTREIDLQELFKPFGPTSRIFLAKDKSTGLSKGFAYVNFIHRKDAARAMKELEGFGFDHLILHLEWAKPSGDRR